jgi:hypothetical protein
MSMKKLKKRLNQILNITTMVHGSSHSGEELRAKITSSSVTVLPDAPNNDNLPSNVMLGDSSTLTKSLDEADSVPYSSTITAEVYEHEFSGSVQSLSPTSADISNANASRFERASPLLNDNTPERGSTTRLLPPEIVLQTLRPSSLHPALLPGYMKESKPASVELLSEPDLLSAVPQKNDENASLWFNRDSFEPLNTDISDNEDEKEVDESITKPDISETASSPGIVTTELDHTKLFETSLDEDLDQGIITEMVQMTRKTYNLDNAFQTTYGRPSPTSTTSSTFASSYASQGSFDFHMENTFLGTTSARDLEERLSIDAKGNVTKEDPARAWVSCVAAEHSDRRSACPSIVAPGVSFIQENDADMALSFEMQRCAKLGRITLLEFLKKFEFDAEGFTAVEKLLSIFREAALESRERIKATKNNPNDRILRLSYFERLEHSEDRGYRS